MLRAFIHVRISKDRVGAGLGVERQEADCRHLAKNLGQSLGKSIVIVYVFVDNDLSAYSGKPRPDYIVMLDELWRGSADMVLAWHTDRPHRSPRELEEYIDVSEQRRLPTYCWKAGLLDLTTSHGRMQARISGAVNPPGGRTHERAHLRAAAPGVAPGPLHRGTAPYGYVQPIQDAGGTIINRAEVGVVPVEDEAAIITEAAGRVIAGEHLHAICRDFTARGIPTPGGSRRWLQPTLKNILINPRYAGFVQHHGEVLEACRPYGPRSCRVDTHYALCSILRTTEQPAHRESRSLNGLAPGCTGAAPAGCRCAPAVAPRSARTVSCLATTGAGRRRTQRCGRNRSTGSSTATCACY